MAGAEVMDWSVIAKSGIDQLTMPKSVGKIVNPHVVRHAETPKPDYDRMRDLAHRTPARPEKPSTEESAS
jgi:hypothetical protein